MQLETGIDLVEIARIKKSLQNPRFLSRFFGQEETELYRQHGKASFLAANFCAKEAFAKALGTGVRGFSLQEVQVLRDNLGKPYLSLSGNANALAAATGYTFSVSLTHTKEYASAVVVAWRP